MSRSLAVDWPYPRLVAHRGAGKVAPENTLTAMRVGHAHGYRMVEFDVKLAADNLSFLLHDATLERTTSGRGRADALLWRELSRLDAGGWHSRQVRGRAAADARVDRAVGARARVCACNIEIKPTIGRERETGAAVALDATALWRDAEVPPLLSSFSEDSLAAARDAAPGLAARAARWTKRPPTGRRGSSGSTASRSTSITRRSPPSLRERFATPASGCCASRRTSPTGSPSSPRGASTASSPTPSIACRRTRSRRRCRCLDALPWGTDHDSRLRKSWSVPAFRRWRRPAA